MNSQGALSSNVANITTTGGSNDTKASAIAWGAGHSGYTFANAINDHVLELSRLQGFLDRTADDSRTGFIGEACQRVNTLRLHLQGMCDELGVIHEQMRDVLAEDLETALKDSGEPEDPPDDQLDDAGMKV